MNHYTVREKNSGTIVTIIEADNINQARSTAAEIHLSVAMSTSSELLNADKSKVITANAPKKRAAPKVDLEQQIKDQEPRGPEPADPGPAASIEDPAFIKNP